MNGRELPYRVIPEYPDQFSAQNVLGRMIDGLGYRYYWATEGLRSEDLAYMPGGGGKSCVEQIHHIYDLSVTILNVAQGKPNVRGMAQKPEFDFANGRQQTLYNLEAASLAIKEMTPAEFEALTIVFQGGENRSEFPIWNLINGQIADAIYHTGQVVSYRRSTNNPINSKVNVFMGRNRE